jgi:predicted aspartyl protease
MRIPIHFVDASGKTTDDFVEGFPVVEVQVDIGFTQSSDPNALIDPKFKRLLALVDTGSNATIIKPDLAAGIAASRSVDAHSMLGQGYGSVHTALIELGGFLHYIEVGTAPLKSIQLVLGRDVLCEYRIVLDTPGREFYLERSS